MNSMTLLNDIPFRYVAASIVGAVKGFNWVQVRFLMPDGSTTDRVVHRDQFEKLGNTFDEEDDTIFADWC